MALATTAAKNLKWKIKPSLRKSLVAYAPATLFSWGEEIRVTVDNEEAHVQSRCTAGQPVAWGKNKKNIRLLLEAISKLKDDIAFYSPPEQNESSGQIEELAELEDPFSPPEEEPVSGNFFSLFIPRQGYMITPILVNLNILIFFLMLISGVNVFVPSAEDLIQWGANFKPVTIEGQWWRLIASCFVHLGIFHLLMNMYALLYIGLILEPLLGNTKFVAAYLLTGLVASASSLWWNENTISAGASGAIFGMYGVFIALLTTNLVEKTTRKAFITSMAIFVGYNLLNGLKPGVDSAAHIGGLAGGIITGYILIPAIKKSWSEDLKMVSIGVASLIIIGVSAWFYSHSTNDLPKYAAKMKKFATMESLALEIFHLPGDTPKETQLSEIKEKGLYYWDEINILLNDAEKLDIPEEYHQRNRKLLEYCDLRIKSYNHLYLFIQTDLPAYKDSVNFYNEKIGKIIDDLAKK
jgi:rhomboid protease GluP